MKQVINSFSKYLLTIYDVPSTALGSGLRVCKTHKVTAFRVYRLVRVVADKKQVKMLTR